MGLLARKYGDRPMCCFTIISSKSCLINRRRSKYIEQKKNDYQREKDKLTSGSEDKYS